MTSYSSSGARVPTSSGARRYFQQFLGETSSLTDSETELIPIVENAENAELLLFTEEAYSFLLENKANATFSVEHIEKINEISYEDGFTLFYIAFVNLLADELDIERPNVAREQKNLSISSTLPPLNHDHLVLVARFALDSVQTKELPSKFSSLNTLVVDRLSSLVELASQAMMGADVDPFETFDHRDCSKCGHLLQCHVGFETWTEVQDEHDKWCPGTKS